MCLDGDKKDRVAFQARRDYQSRTIGWLQRGYSFLGGGKWYDLHEFGWHLGNVGLTKVKISNLTKITEFGDISMISVTPVTFGSLFRYQISEGFL